MLKYKFDGAFGTLYAELGGRETICELANITAPEMVTRIHYEYISAGANAIKTNTYQANSLVFPDGEQLRDVISAGWNLANAVSGTAQVFADIGNISAEPREAEDMYLESAKIFCELGAKNFLFETLDDFEPIKKAIEYIRGCVDAPVIIASFAVAQDGYTRIGRNYVRLISQAIEPCDYAGLNCICGPSVMLGLASRLGELLPGFDYSRLSVMPNASYPARQNGRMTFANNPDYFAEKLSELASLGAGAVGGCCGTTPKHIKAAYELISSNAPAIISKTDTVLTKKSQNFFKAFDYSRKLIAVELNPPLNCDASFFVDCAHRFKAVGADALTVTDSPLARVRADALAMSAKLKRELDIPVLPHLTCRDRNRIAVKGALLAASMDGVDSLLAITGDSPDEGLRADGVKAVYNMSSYGLISYIDSLNTDVFSESPYYIAAALNVNATNFKAELERAVKKISQGASMLMTQAIFTRQSVDNLKLVRSEFKRLGIDCRILAGVMPLAGYKNAVFLANEVGGISIPAELCEALRDASPEQTREISLRFAEDIIDSVWDCCDGFYVMFPLKRAELAEALVEYIKDKDENRV
ncbi:MAG: bifunctional homocysteine S-methyltransferase/methylenetetrahydrofolate reductase [Clostridiales bacterium]|nr:bifunctional homocysteine S-methyltransferase/methylenetetrahydrofolate reductase [Clostridiales bacterium]